MHFTPLKQRWGAGTIYCNIIAEEFTIIIIILQYSYAITNIIAIFL
jgi:hypothetical protein